MRAPKEIRTERLFLKRPLADDVPAIFSRYASDTAIGRYIAWPVHESTEDTLEFLRFSDSEWNKWPAGPYLIFSSDRSTLLGSTGLGFESATLASTGYVIAPDSWGRGVRDRSRAGDDRARGRTGCA